MERVKKEIFEKDHGYKIRLRKPLEQEITDIYAQTDKNFGDVQTREFYQALLSNLPQKETCENISEIAGFKNFLKKLGLINSQSVFIIWNYPDDIDKISLRSLIKYWKDIWVPPADDAVCLYFPEVQKFLVITHWNLVCYL